MESSYHLIHRPVDLQELSLAAVLDREDLAQSFMVADKESQEQAKLLVFLGSRWQVDYGALFGCSCKGLLVVFDLHVSISC